MINNLKNNKTIAQTNKNNEMIEFFKQITFMFNRITNYITLKKTIKIKLNMMEISAKELKLQVAYLNLEVTKTNRHIQVCTQYHDKENKKLGQEHLSLL